MVPDRRPSAQVAPARPPALAAAIGAPGIGATPITVAPELGVDALHARITAAFAAAEPDIARWPGPVRLVTITSLTLLAWAVPVGAIWLVVRGAV